MVNCGYMKNRGRDILNITEETKILAYLARGDSYDQIREAMKEERPSLSKITIRSVKVRNKANLEMLKQHALQKAGEDAGAIKEKANKKLSHRLDDDEKNLAILRKARKDMLDGTLEWKDYKEILRFHTQLTVPELVSVSKEMHNQSQKEPPKGETPQDLAALTAAIRSGDVVKITQAVFNGQSNDTPEELQRAVPTSGS